MADRSPGSSTERSCCESDTKSRTMDADTLGYVRLFQSWLEKTCRVQPSLARPLATEFVTSVGLTEIDQLQLIQNDDPAWLDALKCNIPVLTRRLIVSCVEKIGRVPLHSLTVEDVSLLVHSCFSEFPYNQNFKENLISGFNLEYVNDIEALKQFGIPHEYHAAALMRCIVEWRRVGVPVKLLCLSDEEHNRRITSIKEEKVASRASPALGTATAPVASAGAAHGTTSTPGPDLNISSSSSGGTAARQPISTTDPTHDPAHAQDDELSIISAPCRPDVPTGTAANPILLESSDTQPSGAGGDTDDDNNSVTSLEVDGDNSRTIDVAVEQTHPPKPAAALAPVSLGDVSAVAKRLLSPASAATVVETAGKRARTTGTALPTHALLSGEMLARFGSGDAVGSANSSGSGGGSQVALGVATTHVTATTDVTGGMGADAVTNRAAEGSATQPVNSTTVDPDISASNVGSGNRTFMDVHNAIAQLADDAYQGAVLAGIDGSNDDFGFDGEEGVLNGAQISTEKPIWTSDEDEVSVKDTSSDSSFKPSRGRHGDDDGTWDGDESSDSSSSSSDGDSGSYADSDDDSSFAGRGKRRRSMRRSQNSSGTSGRETRRSLSQRGVASRPTPAEVTAAEESVSGRKRGRPRRGESPQGEAGEAAEGGVAGSSSGTVKEVSPKVSAVALAQPVTQRKKAPKHSVGRKVPSPPSSPEVQRGRVMRTANFRFSKDRSPAPTPTASAPSAISPSPSTRAASSSSKAHSGRRASLTATAKQATARKATARGSHHAPTPTPGDLNGPQKKSFEQLRDKHCPAILHSRSESVLRSAVDHISLGAKKTAAVFIEEIVGSGAFEGLLYFVHDAETLKPTFVYHVLRTVSLIVTRIAASADIHLIFKTGHFKAILKACQHSDVFVRQQALHLISELGVNQDNGLKESVLKGGTVKTIVQCYHNAKPFDNAKSIGVSCQVACGLYKLASNSTPGQFVHFREALPVLYELLTQAPSDGRWSHAVDAALATSFLTSADHPQQIDALRDAKIIDAAVAALQDSTLKDSVRWHCCGILWSVVKHCTARQATGLFRLTAVLGQVFHDETADPHLRAAVLNTMQVLLTRGSVFVGQFINIRGGAFAAGVMETLRTYAYMELVPPMKNSNCVVKYAAFTLANAVLHADSDQLKELLNTGAYPLLFKIIALDGEYDKPEEAKLKAVAALRHIFETLPEQVAAVQARAERRKFNSDASWEMLRGIVGPEDSGAEQGEAGEGAGGGSSSSAVMGTAPGVASPWSVELRRETKEVLRAAEALQMVG